MSTLAEIVVPTVGRPSLARLVSSLVSCDRPFPGKVTVVDDRAAASGPLDLGRDASALDLQVLAGSGRGPAAARNAGWQASRAVWIVFMDDDVVVPASWTAALERDLAAAPEVGGSQARVLVPLPAGRRPTDAERVTQGLQSARWATAEMAYRRAALAATGGFDERFGRAYREDADLAARVQHAGYQLVVGRRRVVHPPRPMRWHASIGAQRGNADDLLMLALHGRSWRRRCAAPPGRRPRHLAIAAAPLLGAGAAVAGRRRLAAAAWTGWAAGTGELLATRLAAGPWTAGEVATMTATSLAIPFAAAWHTVAGVTRLPRRLARGGAQPARHDRRPAAVLLDRDGTLVEDIPGNGDPSRVVLLPAARQAIGRLRAAGVRLAVVTNQAAVGSGHVSLAALDAVHREIERETGPLDGWHVCTHTPQDRCGCRKPASGLVDRALASLGVTPHETALIGDTGADIEAARAAGVRAILVPNTATRPEEVAAAPETAADLAAAVDLLLGGGR